MDCDVILEIGKGKEFKIGKESSSKELDSIEDIVEYLGTQPNTVWEGLLDELWRAPTRQKKDQEYFQGKQLIGNCSFENLKIMFPEEMKLFKNINKPYIITLVDEAFSNGETLKGRVVVNGIVSYVLRNKFDVQNFAQTEYKKYLIEQIVDNDEILDTYLKERYAGKLKAIKNKYNQNAKKITEEIDGVASDTLTLKHLILHYLNNVSTYSKDVVTIDGNPDTVSGILHDFCRELNKQQVINEDSESPLARYLRQLKWDRTEFTKIDLYNSLSNFIPGFSQDCSKQQFIELDEVGMENLLQKYFKDDIILSKYHVVSVNKSVPQETRLNKDQIKRFLNNILKQRNQELKSNNQVELTESYLDTLTTAKAVQEFVANNNTIVIGKNTYAVTISQGKDNSIVYSYQKKAITDNSKVILKRVGRTLEDEFNFGYDTMDIFNPVDETNVEDPVVGGKYRGYYIYEHTSDVKDENGEPKKIYIISKSVISPTLYDPPRFASLRDAKLAVQGFNRSANVEKATKIGLNKIMGNQEGKRSATITYYVNTGQTIDAIEYPINYNTTLPSQEQNLIANSKISEIQEHYLQYGIDISSLDLPEKVGLFLYAMTEKGFTLENIANTDEFVDNHKEDIDNVINAINNAPIKQYLVERSVKNTYNNSGTYTIYIKGLTDAGMVINSTGLDVETQRPPTASLTTSLENLKNVLNEQFFKKTDIKIQITSDDQLQDLKDADGNLIFPNGTDGVRAFIYNDTIYINQNKANTSDLIHETFHIVLGAIKAKDMASQATDNPTNDYETILNFYYSQIPDSTKNRVNTLYEKLAQIDKMEECVVRFLSRKIDSNNIFYSTNVDTKVINLFEELFHLVNKKTKQAVKLDFNTDTEFPSTVSSLINTNIKKMKTNRIYSNMIEQGINLGTIKEECK